MDKDSIIQIILGILTVIEENPPFESMEYDPPIAEARMEIVGGGVMQYKTGSGWHDADDLVDSTGIASYTISTIQQDADGNDLPTSNRITALKWRPDSEGIARNLTVKRV